MEVLNRMFNTYFRDDLSSDRNRDEAYVRVN